MRGLKTLVRESGIIMICDIKRDANANMPISAGLEKKAMIMVPNWTFVWLLTLPK